MLKLEGELSTSPQTSVPAERPAEPDWQLITNGDRPVVAVAVDKNEARVRLGLAFFEGGRVVDVSIQPAAWVGRLRHSASLAGADPDLWERDVQAELLAGGRSEGWWTPATGDPAHLDLVGLAARSAWPLLRLCTDNVREVPRWSTGLLRGPDPVSAVRRQFGTRANRPLVRAIAQHLCGSINWWALACVLAAHSLDADRAVRLLGEPIRHDGEATDHLCTIDEFRLLERTLGSASPSTVLRFLRSEPNGNIRRLLTALDRWERAGERIGALPPTVEEAERQLLHLGEPRPTMQRAVGNWRTPLSAPKVIDLTERPAEFAHPRRARAFHRERQGRIDLLLPVDPDHLVEWSRLLRNCLNDYVDTVSTGESTILGIRLDEQLVGAVELDGRGSVRQMVGRANRPLDEWINHAVLAIIARVRTRNLV